jgi:hypothetical protein
MDINGNMNKESKGLGDSIAKVTKFFGIDTVAEAVAKLAGMEGCGCSERREMLNELFPYENKTRKFRVLKGFEVNRQKYFKGEILEINKKDPIHSIVIIYVRDGILEEI